MHQQQNNPPSAVALIVGVTGMAGLSLAQALKAHNALGGPWKVYGAARRPKPSWFPASYSTVTSPSTPRALTTHGATSPLSLTKSTHVFWVAIQIRESEEANVSVNAVMLANVLDVLKSAPSSRLVHVTLQTGTQHYMGPVHDPAHSAQLIPHDTPFREDSPRLPLPKLLLRARRPDCILRAVVYVFHPPFFHYNRCVFGECVQRAADYGSLRLYLSARGVEVSVPGDSLHVGAFLRHVGCSRFG